MPARARNPAQGDTGSYRPCVRFPHHLPVRVSAAERLLIAEAARGAGMSLSRYVAQAITKKRYPPTIADREELTELRVQLARMGINLNQIARRLNATARGRMSPPTLAQVRGAARALEELSREIGRRLL